MNNVGIILGNLRRKQNITQAELCKGIMSIAGLCKLENGESEVNHLIIETLFERLGKSADNISYYRS